MRTVKNSKMYPPVDVDRFYRFCKGTFKVFED